MSMSVETTMKHCILKNLLTFSLVILFTSSETNGHQDKGSPPQDILKELEAYLTPLGPYVSEQCRNDGEVYLDGLFEKNEWALRMLDAMPKFPPIGILLLGRLLNQLSQSTLLYYTFLNCIKGQQEIIKSGFRS